VTRGRSLVTVVVVLLLGAFSTSVAGGAGTGGRQPPGGIELAGYFSEALWPGTMQIKVAPDGARIYRMTGILPGACFDRRKGRVVRAGPDGAIGMNFDALPNAVIHPDGTFAFSAKVGAGSGFTPHTITVRGTFYGNNVLGRARGRSTKAKYDRLSNCSGNQPFWAKRIG
jgi:hypothetical protein